MKNIFEDIIKIYLETKFYIHRVITRLKSSLRFITISNSDNLKRSAIELKYFYITFFIKIFKIYKKSQEFEETLQIS